MLELLAFDKKSIDFFGFICGDKASLALSLRNKATSEFSYSFKKIVKIESGFWLVFEKVAPMARFEKFFPRGQEYSSTYSVRDKFTAVDI